MTARTDNLDRIRIVWIGFHEEGLDSLEALLEVGYDVVGVMTLNEEQRSKRSGVGDYVSLCARFGVPLYEIRHINDDSSVQILTELRPDVAFVIGWSQIVRSPALDIPSLGMVGSHASLLPNNRGSAPINWAIIWGEKLWGNTLIWLAAGVDEGEIISQRSFPISRYDTCHTVYAKVAETNRDMILEAVKDLHAGNKPGVPQEHTDQNLLPRRRPEDGLVDWNMSADAVYNLIRALTRPYPGAFGFLNGEKVLIWKSACMPDYPSLGIAPGTVLGPMYSPVQHACGQMISCRSGAVVLLEVENGNGVVISGPDLTELDWKGGLWNAS